MNIDCLKNKNISKNKRYALLFGGKGCEREVSVAGAYRFLKEAQKINLDFLSVFISPEFDFYIFEGVPEDLRNISRDEFSKRLIPTHPMKVNGVAGFLKRDELIPIRLVFPLLHGDFGEDGVIQGLLSSLGMNFVGADNFTGAVATDKVYSKIIARFAGVPTLPERVISDKGANVKDLIDDIEQSFGFPVFIKPARLGSSIGASLVKEKESLGRSLELAFSVSDRVMVEPALLSKRELECAYYHIGARKIITDPAEISFDEAFYDYDLKYKRTNGVRLITCADVSDEVRCRIREYTDALSDALCIRHIARFDYFLLPDGRIYFNEVNTMPGMTGTSLYSAMLEEAGLSFSDFLTSFLELDS